MTLDLWGPQGHGMSEHEDQLCVTNFWSVPTTQTSQISEQVSRGVPHSTAPTDSSMAKRLSHHAGFVSVASRGHGAWTRKTKKCDNCSQTTVWFICSAKANGGEVPRSVGYLVVRWNNEGLSFFSLSLYFPPFLVWWANVSNVSFRS